ncbi:hypothetical protein BJ165DRAFT_14514 [Panaeolus papilionaceus]|nr:hypothetical protein BJ165DRAFT_14514 [Panaeolus papilionaceus]
MSVFICPYHDHTALVGWEAVASHIVCSLDSSASWSHGSSILEFSVAGHEVVRSLSTSIGKDWCSASIVELDAAAHIFICTDCPMITCGDDHGSYFFTWRQAVEHGAISSPTHRNFVPVSDETRRYILARKKPLMDPMQTAWACNHCPRHFHDLVPVRRANVIRHLARAHGIKGPRFKNDWVYMGSWSPGDPVFLSRDPSRCFICMMCPPGRHYKMYREQSLKMHLSAKHGVSDPIQNMHWKVLDIPSD